MKPKKNLLPTMFFIFSLLIFVPVYCLELQSPEFGFFMDIPEGFLLTEKRGNDRYRFQNLVFPAEMQIAVYPAENFNTGKEALDHITGQIGSGEPVSEFTWRHRKAAIAKLVFPQGQNPAPDIPGGSGWGAAAELPLGKGWITVISYNYSDSLKKSPVEISEEEIELFHLSVLDSFSTDMGTGYSAGLVTTFCFPKEGEIHSTFETAKTKIPVPFDKSDQEASQYLIEREFKILTKYMGNEYMTDAWKRYYRMIYRDSWERLEKAAFILDNHLPENPRERAEELIQWLFDFTYERNFQGSDFLNLPEAFTDRWGDCDTRSLLLVLLMKQTGTDGVLLISPEFGHSVAAIAIDRDGTYFQINGKKYAVVDLTSSKTGGKLAEEMADPSKWFAVTF